MNHAVVTGASGFIGRHLVATLAGQGVRVTALHRRPVDPSMAIDGVTWVAADVTDKASLAAAMAPGADVVFHLAAALVGPTWWGGTTRGRRGDQRHRRR